LAYLIDSNRQQSPAWGRRLLILIAVLVIAALFASSTLLSSWVNLLWFSSLGYTEVFWKMITLQAGVFAAFTVLTFLILYAAFTALRRANQADLPSAHALVLNGQTINLSVEPVLRIGSLIVAVIIALFSGASMMEDWPTLALFWYAPRSTASLADPIFGKPLNFYLFTLPAWDLLNDWLLTLALVLCAAAAVYFIITSSTRALDKSRTGVFESPWRGLSLAISFLLLVVASMVYVSRFESLFEHHTLFDGISYTDAHITIHGLLLVSIALVLGAIIAAVNAVRIPRARWLAAAILPAAICYIGLGIIGWYVGNFVVKPNELVRETPYITHNIQSTREAFGLDRFVQREFPAETTIDATDPAANQPTLQNIRLWDWHALQDTSRRPPTINQALWVEARCKVL